MEGTAFQEILKLRKQLHKYAELSGDEEKTARIISHFLQKNQPDELYSNLGGHGVAAVYIGKEDGPVVMLRCELDALPILESNDFEYRSVHKKVSHKCGHDGHMAIVAGMSYPLHKNGIDKGKVVLLFQPAEETGQGAEAIMNDPQFESILPDYIFAIHNLPGFPLGSVVLKDQVFASASTGVVIKLLGKTSHAAEPEHAFSPAVAMTEIIAQISALNEQKEDLFSDFSLVTIIHACLGEKAFGTTPGYAEILCTIRAFKDDDLEKLRKYIHGIVEKIAQHHHLNQGITYVEEFPATYNHPELVQLTAGFATDNKMELVKIEVPFRWSEDFGHFTNKYKGMLFGLGAGESQPQLHHPDFDFPDEIISPGMKMYKSIIDYFNRNV